MLFIPLTIDALLLCGIVMGALVTGFWFRSKQIAKSKKRIAELEREMIANHAEILELQKDKLALEARLKGSSIPVIPINSKEEKKSDNKSAGQK